MMRLGLGFPELSSSTAMTPNLRLRAHPGAG